MVTESLIWRLGERASKVERKDLAIRKENSKGGGEGGKGKGVIAMVAGRGRKSARSEKHFLDPLLQGFTVNCYHY